jgi:hypothetical protein
MVKRKVSFALDEGVAKEIERYWHEIAAQEHKAGKSATKLSNVYEELVKIGWTERKKYTKKK